MSWRHYRHRICSWVPKLTWRRFNTKHHRVERFTWATNPGISYHKHVVSQIVLKKIQIPLCGHVSCTATLYPSLHGLMPTIAMTQAVQEVCWLISACQLMRSHWLGAGGRYICSDHGTQDDLDHPFSISLWWKPHKTLWQIRVCTMWMLQPPNLLWVPVTNQSSKILVGI